jgi:hypothetical protein
LSVRCGDRQALLVCCFAGCESREVLRALSESGGVADPLRAQPDPRPLAKDTRKSAQAIWRRSLPISGTIAEVYLRSRGLDPARSGLRFASRIRHAPSGGSAMPAVIAGLSDESGEVIAIQRIYLTPSGKKASLEPARMCLGPLGAAAVRLGPAASSVGLAEGVETALAASQLFGVPAWAACGARLEAVALPRQVREVILFADNDEAGMHTAERASRRFQREGRRVVIRQPPLIGEDWNDVLLARRQDRPA